MRTSILLSVLILVLFSCNVTSETDYKNIAQDTCDCIKLFTNDLSPEMIEIIETSNGDETKLEEGMIEYMTKDPVAGLKDVQLLENSENLDKMTVCMEDIEKKYDDVYTTLSENEIIAKIIEKLEKMDGCQSSIAVLRMGLAAM